MASDFSERDKNKIKKDKLTVKFAINSSKTKRMPENERSNSYIQKMLKILPSASEVKQYISIIIYGILLWGTCWFLFKEYVLPGGYVFNMSALIIIGYIFGHTRIYPVIILTKGPLSWNWEYIKTNSVKVFTLATLPWIVECLTMAFFTHILFGFPWYWGLHLGAILASVSPAVVVPTTIALSSKGFGLKNKIALLVANAGGLDTAFTEGMFGVINSAIFYPSAPHYRIVKALFAIFAGIGLGVTWGVLADFLPDHNDFYAPTIRSLHIFAGGIFITYACGYFGWGGTSGVAIMVCAGTAATRWARRNWPINDNPVAEVFKLLWRIFEPMLFTLSGYFLEVSEISAKEFGLIVACIFSALIIRMLTAFLISVANQLSVKEGIFIAITWMPKAIVEAVLVRVATDSLWADSSTPQDKWIAKHHANMIVIAILITSTLGSVLTTVLGPILLSHDTKVVPADLQRRHSLPVPSPSNFVKTNNILDSLQYIDAQ